MIHYRNYPQLAELFRNDELKKFFLDYLTELEDDPHTLKAFLKEGAENAYNKQIANLSNSFRIVRKTRIEDKAYEVVERSIDGVEFKLGDMVIDEVKRKHDGTIQRYKISRMYEDDRGLHVKLDVNEDQFTWRFLSQINH
jgi:hypothetical protein